MQVLPATWPRDDWSATRERPVEWPGERGGIRVTGLLRLAVWLLILGNVGRIPFLDLGSRQAPLLLNDLAVGIVLLAGAMVSLRLRSLKVNDVALAATVFVAIGGLSAVSGVPRFGLATMELVGSLAYLARWVFYAGIYIVVINHVRNSDAPALWSALEGALLLIAAFGIVQAVVLPNFAFIVYPETGAGTTEWDVQRHRLVSTILEPNVAAGLIVIVLLGQIARLAFGAQTPLWKPILLFAALAMTLSRSGALAFTIGIFVITLVRGLSKRVMRFFAVVFVLLLLSLPRLIEFASEYQRFGVSDGSALARVESWRRAIITFAQHPWFGIGFNTYGYVQERMGFPRASAASYSTEGGLLFIAVMTGVVGLVVYLVMLWVALRRCRRGWRDPRSTPSERSMFVGTAAATIAILVQSVFVNSLLVPFVMEVLWMLWGLTFLADRAVRMREFAGAKIVAT